MSNFYSGTAASLNGKNIATFSPGDQIEITDETPTAANVMVSGNTIQYTGGSITIGNMGPGRYVIRAVETNGTATGTDIRLQQDAHNDFSGDGRSDVLLRLDDGTVREWLGQSDGTSVDNTFAGNISHVNFNPGPGVTVVATGDFNGDGHVDVLTQLSDGTIREWLGQPDGSFVGNIAHVNFNPGPGVTVVGAGDFNGDGRTDVLVQLNDGTIREWLGQADGSLVGNIAHVNFNPGPGVTVVGTGDFNGDGKDDVLVHLADGTIREWLGQSDGSFVGNIAHVNLNPGSGVSVVGTGDFNGDGNSDVLLRLADGTVREWLGQSDGSFVGNIANVNVNPGTGWHVVSIGDFNADATDDVLWRSSDGTFHEWLGQSNGGFVDDPAVNLNPGAGVHVQDPFIHDPFGLG